jgi:hypothetical protein
MDLNEMHRWVGMPGHLTLFQTEPVMVTPPQVQEDKVNTGIFWWACENMNLPRLAVWNSIKFSWLWEIKGTTLDSRWHAHSYSPQWLSSKKKLQLFEDAIFGTDFTLDKNWDWLDGLTSTNEKK